MNRKLPSDAFEYYFGLGSERSYRAVAAKFGVSKKTVTAAARREGWQKKIGERERQANERVEEQAVETLIAMKNRHLKMLSAMQRKALETLQSMPMQTAYQAVRTLVATIEQERLARGEPTERTALSVEEVIRREYQQWMVTGTEKNGDGDDW